jgi:hypothetical protein
MTQRLHLLAACVLAVCTACATAPRQEPHHGQHAFWDGLQPLCGQAWEGTGVHVPATDSAFIGQRFVMHVAECGDGEMRIPFHVGDDRSRTWVLRRVAAGLELKHVHRREDGTESSNSNYGGRTAAAGTPHRQEFPADAFSVAAVPARATQWWFLEHYPGRSFAYGLFREGSGLLYRIEFDLATPVAAPPAPW